MASIFFTERLPGIFIFRTADWFARDAHLRLIPAMLLKRRECQADSFVADIHDEQEDPEPLPQKQGLCQVEEAARF
jgi:hypothetical protein